MMDYYNLDSHSRDTARVTCGVSEFSRAAIAAHELQHVRLKLSLAHLLVQSL
jgi:hypothetical protein